MHIDNDNKTLRAHRLLRLRESRRLLYNLPADVLLAIVIHHHRLTAGDEDLRLLGHQRGRVGHRHVHVLRLGLRLLSFLLRLLGLLRLLRLRPFPRRLRLRLCVPSACVSCAGACVLFSMTICTDT